MTKTQGNGKAQVHPDQWFYRVKEAFTVYEEPGVCEGAPPKELRVAENLHIRFGVGVEVKHLGLHHTL